MNDFIPKITEAISLTDYVTFSPSVIGKASLASEK